MINIFMTNDPNCFQAAAESYRTDPTPPNEGDSLNDRAASHRRIHHSIRTRLFRASENSQNNLSRDLVQPELRYCPVKLRA